MSVILIGELVAAGLIFKFRREIGDEITSFYKKAVREYGTGITEQDELIDEVQWMNQCCGVDDKDEWLHRTNVTTTAYPASCCIKYDPKKPVPCHEPHQRACRPVVEGYLRYVANAAAISAIVIGIVELLAIISACALASSFRKHYQYV